MNPVLLAAALKRAGRLDDALRSGDAVMQNGVPVVVRMPKAEADALVERLGLKCVAHTQRATPLASGPGTELKALLRDWLGIVASPGCSCNSMAARMDRLGPDWCEGPGMPEILGVMRAEHAKRRAAGTTILPWSDTAARQLVLLACRRARASA